MLAGECLCVRAWRAGFRDMDVDSGDYPIEKDQLNSLLRVTARD